MAPLQKKLLRDLWRLRWQVAAIALLIACGVSVAVMAFSAQEALKAAQVRYYQQTRFADVFATLTRAPRSVAADLAAIPGVTAVDTRILKAGLMDVPGLTRPAVARMVSLPQGPGALNLVVLKQGRWPQPGRADEAVALKTFLDAAKVRLGDRLSVTIGGRRMTFTVVGSALSPEYVYVPSPDSTMPDDAHQAVFWMDGRTLERAANLGGAFNTVALRLAPGVSERMVEARVDRILAPYGGRPSYGREDQPSNAFLEAELKELETSASILPPIFLAVAATLVNLVVGRLVDSEREQIGLLKAFGYGDLQAASVYLGLAGAIGLVGAAGGGLLGAELGSAITRLYQQYMRFPVLEPRFHLLAFAGAAGAAVAAAMLGSLGAVRRAARLSPAIAMQPPQPVRYRRGWTDRFTARLDQPSRMILRNLGRYPGRAVATLAGLAASLTLLVGTQFLFDSLEHIIEHAYYRERHASETVAFAEVRDARAIPELRRLPGVLAVEPVRFAPAVIGANGVEERLGITGLEPGARLTEPLERGGARAPFLRRGLVLSEALARRLRVGPGQRVTVQITEGRRPVVALPVTALVEDYSGLAAYMDRRELNRLLGEGDNASGAQLLVAADQRRQFYRAVERAPMIVGASSRDDTVANWRVVMTGAFRTNIIFYVAFAGAIAFGVAYNMSRISLAERGRELATMHVLGFGHAECVYILIGEVALLALLAIPLGVLGGNALARGLILLYSRQDLRLPAMISLRSYGVAITAFLAAVALASVFTARRIWTLDLVAVLKTRE